jgi:hypothetical protein
MHSEANVTILHISALGCHYQGFIRNEELCLQGQLAGTVIFSSAQVPDAIIRAKHVGVLYFHLDVFY